MMKNCLNLKIKFSKIPIILTSLFLWGSSLQAQTLDQSQTDVIEKTSLSNDVHGQSFTTQIAGKLSSIDLYIWNYQNASAQMSLKVFETDANGFPTGTAIATSNVVSIPVTTAWITFSFSGCTNLREGVKYAFIEDWGPSVPLIDDIYWHHSNINTNPYAGGHSFKSPGQNTTSYYAITFDFAFKVFMEGQAAPTAASTQNLCSGSHLVSELTATPVSGATLNWYDAFSSNTPLTGTETVVSGPYWVSQTLNCIEGTRLQITADQTSPAVPVISSNQIYKEGAKYVNLDAVGTNLKWYTAATGGTLIPNTNLVTDNSTAYVSQTVGNCESSRATVNLKEISDSIQHICISGTVANLVTTPSAGNTAEWFSSAVSTNVLADATTLTNGNLFVQQKTTTYDAQLVSNVGTNVRWVKKLNDSTLVFFNANNGHIKSIKIDGTGLTTLQTGLTTLSGMDVDNIGNIIYTQGKQLKVYNVANNTSYVAYDINIGNYTSPSDNFVQGSLTRTNSDNEFKVLTSSGSSSSILYCSIAGVSNAYAYNNVTNVRALEVIAPGNSVYVSSTGELKTQTNPTAIGPFTSGVNDIEFFDNKIYLTHSNQLKRIDADLNPASIVVLNNTLTDDFGDIDVTSDGTIFLGSPFGQKIFKLNQTVSNRLPITIQINNPVAPTAGSLSACTGATIADLTATGVSGAVIKWYAASTGGSPLAATTVLVTGTTYYASQTVNGCESATRAAGTPTIQPVTPAPYNYKVNVGLTFTGQPWQMPPFCFSTHNGIHLENGFENGKRRFTQNGFVFGSPVTSTVKYTGTNWIITDGTTTYFSSSAAGVNDLPPTTGWSGASCSQVNFTSFTIDSLNTMRCVGTALSEITGIGSSIKWYDAATSGNLLPNTTVITSGTHYYASQTVNGCESPTRLDFAPTLISATHSITSTQGVNSCGALANDTILVANASGGTITWWSTDAPGTTNPFYQISTNDTLSLYGPFSSTQTKYVSTSDGTCYSYPRVPVSVTITNTPNIGVTSVDYVLTGNCAGTQTLTFDGIINGKNSYKLILGPSALILKFDGVKWILDLNSTIFAQNTTVPAGILPPATGWTILNPSCPGTFTLTNFVNQTVPNTFCSAATLADVIVSGAQNLKWYNAATGGSLLPMTTALVNGTQYYGTQTINGCESPSRYVLVPSINSNLATGIDVQSACGSFTWTAGNGMTYTSSTNTPTHTIVGGSANGCDSIVTLNLTINSPAAGTAVHTACGSFTWTAGNGMTYSASNNTATHTIAGGAANGCDSIVTLNLTINSPASGTDVQSACGSYTWINGTTYTTSNNTATYTIVGAAANGCDSVVTLNLTINTFVTGTDVQSACGSYTWINGTTYTASNNTATHTIVGGAASGCDSVVTLNLTIQTPATPSNVSVTNIGLTTADVTWDAMTLPVGGFFTIQYQVFPGGTWTSAGTALAGATSTSISGLTPGTLYEVQVAGNCDASTAGSWSASGFFTTNNTSCNAPITMNVISNNGNSITTSWTPTPQAAWYEFRYKTTASSSWTAGGTIGGAASSKFFSGLTPSTSYDFQARTFCPNGTSGAWSNLTVSTNALSGCALAPSTIATALTGTSANIVWAAVPSAGYYQFRYKPTSSSTWISGGTASATSTSKLYTSLSANTAYNFEARTFCSNGVPSSWAAITFTTIALSGCELPPVLNSTANVTTNSVQISWPTVNGAAWYSFQYKLSSSSIWLNGGTAGPSATTKTYNGLLVGMSYDFQARTHCSTGIASAWSGTGSYSTSGGATTMVLNNSNKVDAVEDKNLNVSTHVTTVYPNPASNQVNVEIFMEMASDNTAIRLMDMSGRLVKEVFAQSETGVNTITIDLQGITEGLYTLMVYQNGQIYYTAKIKKQ